MGKPPFRATLYRDRKGGWRWRIVAGNGRKVANSGESYRRRIDAMGMLMMAMDGFGVTEYEVRNDA